MTAGALDIRPAGAAPGQIAAYAALLSEVFQSDRFSEAAIGWRAPTPGTASAWPPTT
jgi:hypothetical protein